MPLAINMAASMITPSDHLHAAKCISCPDARPWPLCRDYSDKMFKDFKWLDKCLGIQNDKYFSGVGACIGKGAVLRISFATFLFFAAHFVALIGQFRLRPWCSWRHKPNSDRATLQASGSDNVRHWVCAAVARRRDTAVQLAAAVPHRLLAGAAGAVAGPRCRLLRDAQQRVQRLLPVRQGRGGRLPCAGHHPVRHLVRPVCVLFFPFPGQTCLARKEMTLRWFKCSVCL